MPQMTDSPCQCFCSLVESAGSANSCGYCWLGLQSSLHQQVAVQLSGQLLLQSNRRVQPAELTQLLHPYLHLVPHTWGDISGGFTAVQPDLCWSCQITGMLT